MSTGEKSGLARVMQVFISSKTSEMAAYRDKAIEAIRDVGMSHKNYNDLEGAGFTQGDKTIFELNRDMIKQSDVFVGLYGFGDVWKPAYHPGLRARHPELSTDPEKLIMEYEHEWAQEAGLYMFRFLCTDRTYEIHPFTPMGSRVDQFRSQLMSRTVGWLTTPEVFYDQLVNSLKAIRPRIFLSYARKNAEYAGDLQLHLRNEDIHVWRDVTNIPGGTEWANELEAAIDLMEALVVVVTVESVQSKWVEKECLAFLKKGKPVIPYIADEASKAASPQYLSSIQYFDGTSSSGFLNLVKQLRVTLGANQ